MYNYQQNAMRKDAERERAAYEKLLVKHEALLLAADEGVSSITVHTESGSITVPVSFRRGHSVCIDLAEVFSKWIDQLERNLNWSIEAIGEEVEAARKEGEAKEEAREARQEAAKQALIDKNLADYSRIMAEQAAATAAPTQRGPGRPKRAASPKPQVAEQLAVAANAVPMNGSSQLPGGGVASQPQG